MNEVPVIREGSYRDYLSNGVGGGLIVGILFFLISLIENSAITAMWIGLALWVFIILLFMGIGFPSEEYFKRKKRIKKLNSEKYEFLHGNQFTLHPDLFFEGEYRGYWFRVLPMTKWQPKKKEIEYDIIEAFYTFDDKGKTGEIEHRLSGNYHLGRVIFANHCAGYLPNDWDNPDFKSNFDDLINIFRRYGLEPFSKNDREKLYGKKLEEERTKDVQSRTKQLVKFGKLDIRYIKPEK